MLKKLTVGAVALAVIAPGADAQDTPSAAPAPQPNGFFGNIFGPNYTRPDPNASPLDQAADLLKQRIKRANEIATDPLAQLFAPEQVQAAREFIPQATEQLQKIEEERQRQADIRQTARNWGLTNIGQFGPAATGVTLANEALRQWKDEGNYNAYKALKGLSPEWGNRADLYMPDAMAKFGQHVGSVQKGMTALNAAASARSETAYSEARNKLIRENDLQAIGIRPDQIPPTLGGWMKARGALQAQYSQAERTSKAFNARQDQLNQAVPTTDERVARAAKAENCDNSKMRNNVASLFTGGTANREVLQVAAEGMSDNCRVYVVSVGDLSSKAEPDRGVKKPERVPVLQVMNLQLRSDGAYEIKGDEAIVWAYGVDFYEVKHSENRDLSNCDSPVIDARVIAASDTAAANTKNDSIRNSQAVGRIMRLYAGSADKAGPHETVIACSFFVPREYEQNGQTHVIVHEILVRSFSNGYASIEWGYVPFDVVRYLHPSTLEHKRWFAGLAQDRP